MKIIILVFCIFSIYINCYAISLEEARDYVMSVIGPDLDSINLYGYPYHVIEDIQTMRGSLVETGEVPKWVFWADLTPNANWSHPSRFYLVNVATGSLSIVDHNWFPSDLNDYICYHTINSSYEPPLNRPLPTREWQGQKNDNAWAVLINGGITYDQNQDAHMNDLSGVYSTLTNYYGFRKEQIFVFSADGYAHGNHGRVDLDGDGVPEIDGAGSAATQENILQCFQSLADINTGLDEDDILFVYVGDHGAREDDESSICLWDIDGDYVLDDNEMISSQELSICNETINCSQKIYLMAQCYAGGFIHDQNNLTGSKTVVMTAVDSEEVSIFNRPNVNMPGSGFGEYPFYWISAMRGYFPSEDAPYNNVRYFDNPSVEIPLWDFASLPAFLPPNTMPRMKRDLDIWSIDHLVIPVRPDHLLLPTSQSHIHSSLYLLHSSRSACFPQGRRATNPSRLYREIPSLYMEMLKLSYRVD